MRTAVLLVPLLCALVAAIAVTRLPMPSEYGVYTCLRAHPTVADVMLVCGTNEEEGRVEVARGRGVWPRADISVFSCFLFLVFFFFLLILLFLLATRRQRNQPVLTRNRKADATDCTGSVQCMLDCVSNFVMSSELFGCFSLFSRSVLFFPPSPLVPLTRAPHARSFSLCSDKTGPISMLNTTSFTLLPGSFADLTPLVNSSDERGLLDLAFHPDYAVNGLIFVHYSREGDGAAQISAYARALCIFISYFYLFL